MGLHFSSKKNRNISNFRSQETNRRISARRFSELILTFFAGYKQEPMRINDNKKYCKIKSKDPIDLQEEQWEQYWHICLAEEEIRNWIESYIKVSKWRLYVTHPKFKSRLEDQLRWNPLAELLNNQELQMHQELDDYLDRSQYEFFERYCRELVEQEEWNTTLILKLFYHNMLVMIDNVTDKALQFSTPEDEEIW